MHCPEMLFGGGHRRVTHSQLQSRRSGHGSEGTPHVEKSYYVLELGDEIDLSGLPVPLSQFFLSQDRVLCRYWQQKPVSVEQLVIPEKLVP